MSTHTAVRLTKNVKDLGNKGDVVYIPTIAAPKFIKSGKGVELSVGDFPKNDNESVAQIRERMGWKPLENPPETPDPNAPLPVEYTIEEEEGAIL